MASSPFIHALAPGHRKVATGTTLTSQAAIALAYVVDGVDIRAYRRLNAMALASPAGFRIFQRARAAGKVGAQVSKLRIYCDETMKRGERLTLEVFPNGAQGPAVKLLVEVAWVMRYPDASRAEYEVGLDVKRIAAWDEERLEGVLG